MEEQLLLNERKNKFGIYESALASLIFIILNVVFLRLFYLLPTNIRLNEFVYYIASFLIEFMFALTAIIVAESRNINLIKASGMNKKINGKMIGIGFLISIVSLIGFGNLTSIFIQFLNFCGYSSVLSDMAITTFWQYLIYVLISCAAPAFFEELLFRGVIASGLKERGFKAALFVSALIFTLMHGNAEQTVHQFIIGLIVGYIFIKSGNLWLGVIIHFFNNFISVTELYIFGLLSKNASAAPVEEVATTTVAQYIISVIVAIVFAFIAYNIVKYLIARYLEEDKKLNKSSDALGETTIVVEGQEQTTQMMIDGQPVSASTEQTTDETLSDVSLGETKVDKTKGLSVSTIVLFSLSLAYLAFDWISSLLIGFNLF